MADRSAYRDQRPDADGDDAASGLVGMLLKLPAFRRAISGQTVRVTVPELAAAVVMSALAVGLRFLLEPLLPPGFPYITFFPCIVITGFIWGMIPSATSAILCGLAAWYWFIPPVASFALSAQSAAALAFYGVVAGIDLVLLQLALYTAGSQARAQMALTQALKMQEVVSQEIDHRFKNMLASITGLVSLSVRHAETPEELAEHLRQRIGAMSHSVGLLRGAARGEETGVRDVIEATLAPLGIGNGERLSLQGDNITVAANSVIPLSLILHELATNAFKYGALSQDTGKVAIHCHLIPTEGTSRLLRLEWTEQAGPPVTQPEKTGFGTALITRMTRALGGTATFRFEAEGLAVVMDMDCGMVLGDG